MRVAVTLADNNEYEIDLECSSHFFYANLDDFVIGDKLALDNAYLKEYELSEQGLILDPQDDSFYLVPFRIL